MCSLGISNYILHSSFFLVSYLLTIFLYNFFPSFSQESKIPFSKNVWSFWSKTGEDWSLCIPRIRNVFHVNNFPMILISDNLKKQDLGNMADAVRHSSLASSTFPGFSKKYEAAHCRDERRRPSGWLILSGFVFQLLSSISRVVRNYFKLTPELIVLLGGRSS